MMFVSGRKAIFRIFKQNKCRKQYTLHAPFRAHGKIEPYKKC